MEIENKIKELEDKIDKMNKELNKKLDMIHSLIVALGSGDLKL